MRHPHQGKLARNDAPPARNRPGDSKRALRLRPIVVPPTHPQAHHQTVGMLRCRRSSPCGPRSRRAPAPFEHALRMPAAPVEKLAYSLELRIPLPPGNTRLSGYRHRTLRQFQCPKASNHRYSYALIPFEPTHSVSGSIRSPALENWHNCRFRR